MKLYRVILVCTLLLLAATPSFAIPTCTECLDVGVGPCINAPGQPYRCRFITNAEGRAQVAVSDAGSCAIYVLPKEGSLAVGRVSGKEPLVLRVPDGSSSLRLALKSETGDVFSDLWLLMRIDGTVIPPVIARQLASRGLALVTDTAGSISLAHIPPGTYEFWPYRTEAEGQMLYEVASDIEAPISVKVLTGENNATVRFQVRR